MTAVIGAGTYCLPTLELLADCGVHVDLVVDDDPTVISPRDDLQVVTRDQLLAQPSRPSAAVIAIGNGRVRRAMADWCAGNGLHVHGAVHPESYVAPSATLGDGCLIHRGAFVWSAVRLGRGVILSPGARVAHHSTLGDYAMAAMGSLVGASVAVGDGAFIGMGASIMTGVRSIGRDAIVGAGAVVVRDVPAGVTVAGVPAREVGRGPREAGA